MDDDENDDHYCYYPKDIQDLNEKKSNTIINNCTIVMNAARPYSPSTQYARVTPELCV